MTRVAWSVLLLSLTSAGMRTPIAAQDLTAVCRPVEYPSVGGWARYRLRGERDSTEMRMAIVGATMVGPARHLWQESILVTPAGTAVIQSLVPAEPYDPTAIRRAIVRAPGQDPVELPASALDAVKARGAQGATGLDACRAGEPLGWETISVPAGRVRAMHVRYRRDGRSADVWLAPGVPFAVVRSTVAGGPDGSAAVELVLVGHGIDALPSMPLPDAPGR